ncbi:hypothetical protein LCGC14_2449450, partial [marine sediment metagenome]
SGYADYWGRKECRKVNGKWINMDGGKHCVDKDLKEIDIYNN